MLERPSYFACGRYSFNLDLASRPLVMGILNVTPDSFFKGSRVSSLAHVIDRAEEMIAAGVDIIDVGGESTRPGATKISIQEELDRVMPVLYALKECGKPISIDTCKPQVMRHAIAVGVDMVNDVRAFQEQESIISVAKSGCGICVMHMQNQPETMQLAPHYENVVDEVIHFLLERVNVLNQAGVDFNRICVDPGFGFGKTLPHNLILLNQLDVFSQRVRLPLLVGVSRKSMIGALTGKPVEGRMAGSVSAALFAAMRGAKIVRVHDVAETVDALTVWYQIQQENG
jgi:dihydropteroate synthase